MRLTVAAAALASLLLLPSPSRASAQFTQMNVALSTLDSAKPSDTPFEISILPDAGGDPVAFLSVPDKELAANSTDKEVVPSAGGGFQLEDVKKHYILLRTNAARPGVWKVSMDVILQFDDGSQALLGCGKLVLSSSNPQAIVPLSLATVAHPGVLGGVEKFGFRLLSKSTAGPSANASASAVPHKSPKEFTHMDLAFETGAKGSDGSGRVEVSIVPKDGGPAVAYLDLPGKAFYPYQKQSVVVPSAGEGFTLDDLKNEQILVRITTSGYETWTCKFDAILHFANGASAMIGSSDLALSSGNDHQMVALKDAVVAGTGMFGRIEKLTFKIVSKGAVSATTEPVSGGSPGTAAARSPGSSGARGSSSPEGTAAPMAPDAFTGMEVKLWSGSFGKNAATRVELSIEPKQGGAPVAYLDLQDRAIGPGTSAQVTVPPANGGFTKAQLRDQQIVVKITPSGSVNWTHGMDVVLHFADGSAALWSTGDMVLNSYKTDEVVPLASATLASRGLMGGVEKFGFGLLNHLGK